MSTCALYAHRLGDPAPTGIARYAAEMVARLAGPGQPRRGVAYTAAASRERSAPREDGTTGARVRRPPVPRAALHLAWSAAGRPTVDRWIGRPDLVHVLYPSTPVPSRAPQVVTIHDLMPLQHPDWFAYGEAWRFRRAIRWAADHAVRLVANSAKTARELTDLVGVDPARIEVVHLGVADEFRAAPDPAAVAAACARHGLRPGTYLMTVGSVSRRKNLFPVIDALERLADRDLTLVSIGPDGDGADLVRAHVAAAGLGTRVRFLGWRPDAEARDLLAGALALVHPSVAEGFGLPPLEAMALGVPALASRAGSLPEVCGDAALLLDPHDPDAWAGGIDAVADPARRGSLVAAGRTWSAGFTWEAHAAAVAALHRTLLGA
ncbi:MAG: glycosyltransferase family 1 protein [Acidimicrobiales bacterium]